MERRAAGEQENRVVWEIDGKFYDGPIHDDTRKETDPPENEAFLIKYIENWTELHE